MADKDKYGKAGQIESSVAGAYTFLPFAKAKTFLAAYFRPVEVIKAEQKSFSLGGAFTNLAIAGFIIGLAMGFANLLSALFGTSLMMRGPLAAGAGIGGAVVGLVVLAVVMPIIYPIAYAIGSAVYFVVAKVLGGKGSYTSQTHALSLVLGGVALLTFPLQVLGAIPFVGFIFALLSAAVGIYALYSYFRVFRQVHQLSNLRAAAVLVLPPLVAMIVIFVLFAAVLMYFLSAVSQTTMMY